MDTWDEGSGYDGSMGRWSRSMARGFLAWLDVPPGAGWVDVGCGTGALADTIAAAARPGKLAGVDPSSGFIAAARDQLGVGADLRVGDAQPGSNGRLPSTTSGTGVSPMVVVSQVVACDT